MFRIEKVSDGRSITLRLSGRVENEQVPEIQEQIDCCPQPPTLDLQEVFLADRATVRFLLQCQGRGIEILHCPLYIQEWMLREKLHGNASSDGL